MIGIFQNEGLRKNKKDIFEKYWTMVTQVIAGEKAPEVRDIKIKLDGKIKDLKDIVLSDFNSLTKYKKNKEVNRCKYELIIYNNDGNIKKKSVDFKRKYSEIRKNYGNKIAEMLEVTVCPYCNRNFINGDKNYTNAEFDHYYAKTDFSLLALSLFNLVPCCHSCNHKKAKQELSYSPYDNSKTTDQLITFSFIVKGIDSYQIVLLPGKVAKEMKENVRVLKIEEQYAIHTDIVKELIYKARYYPPNYLASISKINRYVSLNPEEVYYGVPMSESAYYKRPLSKFITDIVRQVKDDLREYEKR